MKLLLICCSVIAASLAADEVPDCGEQFRTGGTCILDSVKARIASLPEMKIDFEAKEAAIKKCFADNGCTAANTTDDYENYYDEDYEDGDSPLGQLQHRLQGISDILGIDSSQLQKMIAAGISCSSEIRPKIKPDVEKCVHTLKPELKTFTLPDLEPLFNDTMLMGNKITADSEFRAQVSPHGIDAVMSFIAVSQSFYEMKMKALVGLTHALFDTRVCPKDARKATRKCIEDAIDKALPEELKCVKPAAPFFDFAEEVQNLCDDRDKCLKKMDSAVCVELLPKVPGMVCTCAQAYMEDNWDTLSKTMLECVNKKVGGEKPLTLPPLLANGPLKQVALKLMQQQCEALSQGTDDISDPCSGDFDIFHPLDKPQKAPPMPKGPPPPPPAPPAKDKSAKS